MKGLQAALDVVEGRVDGPLRRAHGLGSEARPQLQADVLQLEGSILRLILQCKTYQVETLHPGRRYRRTT